MIVHEWEGIMDIWHCSTVDNEFATQYSFDISLAPLCQNMTVSERTVWLIEEPLSLSSFILPTTGWCYVRLKSLDRPKSLALLILSYELWTYIAYILLIYFSLGAVYYARRRKTSEVWMIICMVCTCMYVCMYVCVAVPGRNWAFRCVFWPRYRVRSAVARNFC